MILLVVFFVCILPVLGHAQVVVSWAWLSEIQEAGFDLERSPSGCADWAVIGVFPANIMQTEDMDVPGNCYRVRAFDQVKYYSYSNVAIVPPSPPPPPPTDAIKPTVSIASPANNSNVQRRSTVTIRSIFSDNVGVIQVRYLVNSSALNCQPLATSCSWAVPSPPNRRYTIKVEARDQAGNVGEAQVNVRSNR